VLAAIEGGLRVYRIDRMAEVEPIDERFQRPATFDLEAEWAARRAEVEAPTRGHEVVVAVSTQMMPMFLRMIGGELVQPAERLDPDDAGRARFTLTFRVAAAMRAMMLAFGTEVEVLSPPEVRTQLHRIAVTIARRYATRNASPASARVE
jgi:predicted DNA-binding transcriptional regulator YafY